MPRVPVDPDLARPRPELLLAVRLAAPVVPDEPLDPLELPPAEERVAAPLDLARLLLLLPPERDELEPDPVDFDPVDFEAEDREAELFDLDAPDFELLERPLLALPPLLRDEPVEDEPLDPLLRDELSSSDHLPDSTRCAASATASAISEPRRVALETAALAALLAVSAASRPASRILRRAAGLALIAAAAAASPAASISRLIAAFAILSTVLSPEPDELEELLFLLDFAIAGLPLSQERHFKAVTVPE